MLVIGGVCSELGGKDRSRRSSGHGPQRGFMFQVEPQELSLAELPEPPRVEFLEPLRAELLEPPLAELPEQPLLLF